MAANAPHRQDTRKEALEMAIRTHSQTVLSNKTAPTHADLVVETAAKFEEFIMNGKKEGTSGDTVGSDTPQ